MKRLKKTVPSKNTTRKKNNGGMTYIELLVALSLLVLIVTMFTPMLLNSYDSIYKAGELTYNSYDARKDIEKGLAYRDDHTIINLGTNFEKFGSTINIKARQVISVANGLESLYSNAKARLIIVNDSIVMDNQQCQSVRINVKNINKTAFNKAGSANAAKKPGDHEVLFYVHSIYNDRVPLNYDIKVVDSTKYIDIFFNDVDVTMAPIKILAYYKDDFGQVRDVATYLFIEPADMMFVGKTTGDADYFTSAGVEVENKDDGTSTTNFFIAGREMKSDAHIGEGKVLNDVEWVSTFNDSTIKDGYYIMCGENSVVRRLWRARDTSKSPQITYNSVAVNGDAYFQYSWKGDYTDVYNHKSESGAGASHYGSNSTSNVKDGDTNTELTKDQYGLHGSSHAYSFNGFTGNWYNNSSIASAKDKSIGLGRAMKRISYVLYADANTAKAAGCVPDSFGMWTKWGTKNGKPDGGGDSHEDRVMQAYKDQDEINLVYNVSDNKWYYRSTYKSGIFTTYHLYKEKQANISGQTKVLQGISYSPETWLDCVNGRNYTASGDMFFKRDGVPSNKAWEGGSYDWVSDSVTGDEDVACLVIKIYNNFSSDELRNNTSSVSQPSYNPISLTSCSALPGKNGNTMYYGTTDANAMIHQTNGRNSNDKDTRKQGLFAGYFFASLGEDSTGEPITKWRKYEQQYKDGITDSISPDWQFAINSLINEKPTTNQSATNWSEYVAPETTSKVAFTMGYSSDLYALYGSFVEGDLAKTIEKSYLLSTFGSEVVNDEARKNLWFPREFYNILESDSYGTSVVAVGYNLSGKSKVQYNEIYSDYGTYNSSLIRKYNNGRGELQITGAQIQAEGWYVGGNHGSNFVYLDGFVGAGKQFWIKLPRQVVASTAFDKLINDGVIAVYNEPKSNQNSATFQNIYYYRAPNEESVRFNCVSTVAISDKIVGAAVGMSNGKVMFANIGYDNGAFKTDALTAENCPEYDAIPEITSVTAVKAINNDITGTSGKIILAGGVVKDGCQPILRIIDTSAPSTVYKVLLEEDVTNVTKITDIVTSKGYVYVSAIKKNSDDGTYSGVIYAIEIAALKGVTGVKDDSTYFKPEIDAGGKMVSAWIKKEVYHKAFTTDADGNVVPVPGDNGTRLPIINSIAALAE